MKTLKIGTLALCLFAAGSAVAMDPKLEQKQALFIEVSTLYSKLLHANLKPADRAEVDLVPVVVEILTEDVEDIDVALASLRELKGMLAAHVLAMEYPQVAKAKEVVFVLPPKKFIALGAIAAVATVYCIYKLVTAKTKTKSVDIEETDVDEQELELV